MVIRIHKLTVWIALLHAAPVLAQGMAAESSSGALELRAATPSATTAETEAKLAFDAGLRLLRAERWGEAEVSFRRSLAQVQRPSAKYDLAFVLFKQGRLRQSSELLQDLLNNSNGPAADVRYHEYAKALLANVLSAFPVLHLSISPATAEVKIDGQPLAVSGGKRSMPVDPGTHRVQVSAPGFVAKETEVVTQSRSETRREITLSQLPSPDKSKAMTSKPGSAAEPKQSFLVTAGHWVAIGVGAALVASAIVTGVLAKNADEDFTRQCPTLNNCDPHLKGLRDKASHLGTATGVLLASGAVFVVGGVSLHLLVRPRPTPEAGRSLLLGGSMRF
jgi:hypothetical protein